MVSLFSLDTNFFRKQTHVFLTHKPRRFAHLMVRAIFGVQQGSPNNNNNNNIKETSSLQDLRRQHSLVTASFHRPLKFRFLQQQQQQQRSNNMVKNDPTQQQQPQQSTTTTTMTASPNSVVMEFRPYSFIVHSSTTSKSEKNPSGSNRGPQQPPQQQQHQDSSSEEHHQNLDEWHDADPDHHHPYLDLSSSSSFTTTCIIPLVESTDVYQSPVGVLRVHSFPYLGHSPEEQPQGRGQGDAQAVPQDGDNNNDDVLDVSSHLRRSMSAYGHSWDATTKTFVMPPSALPPPARNKHVVTHDGFPILDATDSMDTERMSNVTVGTSIMQTISSSSPSSSNTNNNNENKHKNKIRSILKKAASEKFATSKRRTTTTTKTDPVVDPTDPNVATAATTVPSTNSNTLPSSSSSSSQCPAPQPQQSNPIYEILENVAERVSGLSLEASNNLLSPIQAFCTAPAVDPIMDHDSITSYQTGAPQQEAKSAAAALLLSCASACHTAPDDEEVKTKTDCVSTKTARSHIRSLSLGSTPAGLQAMYLPDAEFFDYAPCRTDHQGHSRNRAVGQKEECPSTEITLEATYASNKALQGGVMALSEKCDQTSGEVVMKVAMLSPKNQDPTTAVTTTSLVRKRQIVSGAKRWLAVARKQHPAPRVVPPPTLPEQVQLMTTTTATCLSPASDASNAPAVSQTFTPGLRSTKSPGPSDQPPCQPILTSPSSSSLDDLHHRLPPPPSSLSSNPRSSGRLLPRRSLTPICLPLACSSEDPPQQEQDLRSPLADNTEEHRARNNQTPAAAITTTTVATSSQFQKRIRISPVSIAEFRDV
jgi:hypothetical protein